MRIIGIDPGYAIMGWGIVDYVGNKFTTVDYGAITSDAEMPTEKRLSIIYDELREIIDKYSPDEASVEKLFFNTNTTTAITVAEARGIALLVCEQNNVALNEYTPLQIKMGLVGYGRAEKKQVQEMVKLILNLNEVPKPDDTADALAAAICHAHTGGSRLRIK